ncbi:MAG: hypothetical protein AAF265_02515 [Pseudomonadota bacterium]
MQIDVPVFSEQRLNGLTAAFRNRGKAIKHRGCVLAFTRETDLGFERLNIDCDQIGSPPIQTRVSVWNDGRMYFRTCQSAKKGWKFCVEMYGDAFLINEAKLVSIFEKSLGVSDEDELRSHWGAVDPYMN